MKLTYIIILAIIQGLAELLPVSSSAHVITAAKLMHLDPAAPDFVLMLVMLHTGTMFAVIVYFWKSWKRTFFQSQDQFLRFFTKIVIATGITGCLGYGLIKVIEHSLDPGYTRFESWSISEVAPESSPAKSIAGHMQPAATSSSSASSAGAGPASPPTLHAPTGDSLLINLVSTADPAQKKLFKQGEIYSLNVKKGGGLLGTGLMMETMPYDEIKVTSKSTLNDLKKTFIRGFAINTQAHVKRFPDPGVELVPAGVDPKNPNGVKIVVTGNAGRDNRLKLAEGGFVDTNDLPVFGLLDVTKGEVEQLFKRMDLVAAALAAAGVLILFTGIFTAFKNPTRKGITTADGVWLGAIQGISLPFRGFSRSGVTISLGLLRGIDRKRAEEFSFAMAVALTPAALGYEAYKLYEKLKQTSPVGMGLHDLKPGLEGLLFSFGAGLIALKLLSKLLEKGQWWIFGVYCLAASAGVYYLHLYPHALDHSLHFLHPES